MKNCDEMVNSLLKRREQYNAEKKRRRTMLTRTVTSMCSVCLVALLGFDMWHGGIFRTTPMDQTIDDALYPGVKDTFDESKSESSLNSEISQNTGNHPSNYIPKGNEWTIISSFDGDNMSASYVTPENGKFCFSTPLQMAMDEYGDDVLYRVFIDVFSNNELLAPDSKQVKEEVERLSNNGYIVAYETYFDGTSYHYYFTLQAKLKELTEFNAKENYGYFMFLYDERVGSN